MDTTRQKQIAHEAAKILLDTESVLFNATEPFTYTSGKKGPVYTDCRRLISFTEERETLMGFAVEMLSETIGMENLDYIAGGETAGIPYAAFIAQLMHKPMLYIRKKPKGFGRMAQIEGHMPEGGCNVILTEDALNFGTSVSTFVPVLREAKAIIKDMFVVFSHGHTATQDRLNDLGVRLHALTTMADVVTVAREEKMVDEQTLDAVESYLANPKEWAA